MSEQLNQYIDGLVAEVARLVKGDGEPNPLKAGAARRPDLAPAGSGARVTPGWELEYARARFDPDPKVNHELKKWRTPAHDREAVEFLRACATNDQSMLREIDDREHNRAARAEWGRAALAEGTIGSPGTGFGVVPVGFANSIETILARASRLRQYVNIKLGSSFALKMPVQGTKTVAAEYAEAGSMASGGTDPTYTHVTAEARKLGKMVVFSRELLDDSPLELVSLVTRDIGEAIGTLEDLAICQGSVFTNTLLALTPHGTITWTDATETLSTLITKYYALAGVFRSRATWIINEAAAAVLSAITGTGERQLFTEFNPPPTLIDDVGGQTGVLLGRPVLVLPTGATGWTADKGFFGDLSGYTLYVREQLRVETSVDSHFSTDQVALRVVRREQGVVTQAGRMVLFG